MADLEVNEDEQLEHNHSLGSTEESAENLRRRIRERIMENNALNDARVITTTPPKQFSSKNSTKESNNSVLQFVSSLFVYALTIVNVVFVVLFQKSKGVSEVEQTPKESNKPDVIKNGQSLRNNQLKKSTKEDIEKTMNALREKWNMKNHGMWEEIDPSSTKVRGKSYMKDKVKIDAGKCFGKLLHVDLVKAPIGKAMEHVALKELKRSHSLIQKFSDDHADVHIFIVNFQIPGNPVINLVCYWSIPLFLLDEEHESDIAFYNLFRYFIQSTPDICDARLKLIPKIVEGPWVLLKSVPDKPAILGKKIDLRYYAGRNYYEVDVDLSSSIIASHIVSMCRSYSTNLVVDLSLVLQGETEDELPERIFAAIRFSRLDLQCALPISLFNCTTVAH